jgi:hypothetical protein
MVGEPSKKPPTAGTFSAVFSVGNEPIGTDTDSSGFPTMNGTLSADPTMNAPGCLDLKQF